MSAQTMNTTSADAYLQDGCGRCDRYRTPDCKVHLWTEPLQALRALLLATELTEEMKWGSPCYTLGGENVAMLTAFKERCALSFFQGALLSDAEGLLQAPGPNSRSVRLLPFTSAEQVHERRSSIGRFIDEATELRRSGARVAFHPTPEPIPEELRARLDADPEAAAAFEALTPGRRRSYALHVGGAMKSATRAARAERCVPRILSGKGFNER